ncbi:unnamed protein product [Heligmosomoides polygyrus]|uniref:Endo/exonuclease/phosphatase domain-containing protein n=1 Tax=Heligmosomoides polygyrus TaxID=6339 RepID=A0A183G9M0_HELPZ|nr:unnamed protein product [Heligmosomoides polygyrus]
MIASFQQWASRRYANAMNAPYLPRMRHDDLREVAKASPCHINLVFSLVRIILMTPYVLMNYDLSLDPRSNAECGKSRDIGSDFKAVLCGIPGTTSGVGVNVSDRFRDSIVSVERFDDRLMKIVVAAKEQLFYFFSAYAPQTGCSDQARDEFWNLLDEKTAEVPPKDVIIVAGDLSGHVRAPKDGYSCHGGFGYRARNTDGERILDFAESHNLTIVNTVFRKRDSHLISYNSGSSKSQLGFVLWKNRDRDGLPTASTADVHPKDRPSEAKVNRAMRCCKNKVVANKREGSSCDFTRTVADSHDCRRNWEESNRRDTPGCKIGTRHYEAWATQSRQADMAVDGR